MLPFLVFDYLVRVMDRGKMPSQKNASPEEEAGSQSEEEAGRLMEGG